MKDATKTKGQLLAELEELRNQVALLKEGQAKSDEKFRLIFDHSLDGILLADTETRKFFLGNRAIHRLLGYSPQELTQLGVADIHPPEALPQVLGEFEKMVQSGTELVRNIPVKRKDGTIFWADIGGTLISLENRDFLIGVFRDVTDRKEAEEALLDSEYRQKALLNSIVDGAWFKDLEGKYVAVNEALAKTTNREMNSILGKTDEELWSWELGQQFRAEDLDVIRSGKTRIGLRSRIDKKGRTTWIETIKTPVYNNNGEIVGTSGVSRNISYRKLAEEAIEKERDKARQFLDIAGVILIVLGADQKISLLNKKGCQVLGYEEREVLGLNWFEVFIPARMQEEVKGVFTKLMTGELESVEYVENPILTRDGGERIIAWHNTLIKGDDGSITGILSSGEDITDHKRADEELQKLASVVRHSRELVNLATFDGRMIFLNEAGREMLGIESSEVENTHILQVIPEHLQGLVRTELLPKLTAMESWEGELQYLNLKTGQLTDVFASAFIITDPATGGPLCMANISLDISERKKAELQLKESEERYRTVADFTYDWEQWVAADGRFLYTSPSCERITGYPARDFLDRPSLFYEIVHPDDAEVVKTHFLGDHYSPEVLRFEFRIITRDGKERWIDHICQPVSDLQGRSLGRRASNRDITDQKRIQEQLRLAQRMEAIGTLAGGIAHDFNNILTPILMGTELAQMAVPGDNPAQMDLQKVLQATHRARDLVKQILTFSHQGDEELRPFNLIPVVKEVIKLIRASLPAMIEVVSRIEAASDIIQGNPIHIHQVVMNLCTNAAQAMKEKGGRLEIGLNNETLNEGDLPQWEGQKPGPFLKLTVRDTGHGMDSRILEKIFDPFFTTKERGDGTGMGLSVVHGIVKNLGGAISVESKPGEGTLFTIILPGIDGEPVKETDDINFPVAKGQERILFIDDEVVIPDLYKKFLEQLGYEVAIRDNPSQAWEYLQEKPDRVDIVICDQAMPDMTGIELSKKILGLRPDMPIILHTGFGKEDVAEIATGIGIKEVLYKPVGRLTLVQTIRRVLDETRVG